MLFTIFALGLLVPFIKADGQVVELVDGSDCGGSKVTFSSGKITKITSENNAHQITLHFSVDVKEDLSKDVVLKVTGTHDQQNGVEVAISQTQNLCDLVEKHSWDQYVGVFGEHCGANAGTYATGEGGYLFQNIWYDLKDEDYSGDADVTFEMIDGQELIGCLTFENALQPWW